MKSFIAKRLNSILVNLRYLRFKLLKYKENNKKICNTFDHNFKNIPLYIMRKVSLERYYFVLYDCALTSKMSKMALKSFCDKTLHIVLFVFSHKVLNFYLNFCSVNHRNQLILNPCTGIFLILNSIAETYIIFAPLNSDKKMYIMYVYTF